MNINMLQNINLRKNILILRGLICAVDIHRKAMKFVFDNMHALYMHSNIFLFFKDCPNS